MIPGLWFNQDGPLAKKLVQDGYTILNLRGLKTLKDRTDAILTWLQEHPGTRKIIAHSGACPVLVKALENWEGPEMEVILMNPGLLPGVMFTPRDPSYWVTFKHLLSMMLGKDIMLSDKDFMSLLSIPQESLSDLAPESGTYIYRGVVLPQFKFWHKVKVSNHINIVVILSEKDRIIGSTGFKTASALQRATGGKAKVFQIGSGHMWSMNNLEKVVEAINDC